MSIQLFKNRKGVIIVTCMMVILLIYSVDIYKLSYRFAAWRQFGEMPVEVGEIQSFVADTPVVIGYKEPGGSMVSCAKTVIYLKSTTQKTYRCCDTGDKISCLPGDYSNDIPAFDTKCMTYLQSLFGVPESMENSKEYKLFGSCPRDGSSSLVVAQLDNHGRIQWKLLNSGMLDIYSNFMRCVLVPGLLIISIWMIVSTLKEQKKEAVRRF